MTPRELSGYFYSVNLVLVVAKPKFIDWLRSVSMDNGFSYTWREEETGAYLVPSIGRLGENPFRGMIEQMKPIWLDSELLRFPTARPLFRNACTATVFDDYFSITIRDSVADVRLVSPAVMSTYVRDPHDFA